MASGREVELGSLSAVGRRQSQGVPLEDIEASSHHAELRWGEAGWTVRDQASKNGTWRNGRAIRAGERVRLRRGDRLRFGSPAEEWELIDPGPPRPALIPLGGGEPLLLDEGPAALPSEERVEASAFLDAEGFALVETATERRPLSDGETLQVGARGFRVQLPRHVAPTQTARPRLAEALVRLSPSLHEEHVTIEVVTQGRTSALPARACNYVLLLLARQRLSDRERGVRASEQGWITADDFADRLRMDRGLINTYVHRLRAGFSRLQLDDATDVVQRRLDTHEMRTGCDQLEIVGD